jgi:hypothetical protein
MKINTQEFTEAAFSKISLISTATGSITAFAWDQLLHHSIGSIYVIVNTALAFTVTQILQRYFKPGNKK